MSNPEKTIYQFEEVFVRCRALFLKKYEDYGSSWRILRPASLTDQLYIKAKRIRSIEELGKQKVEDSIESDYIGLVNYSIMALIQLLPTDDKDMHLDRNEVEHAYDTWADQAKNLLLAKNHDYGEAWRGMRISSMTDLILMKLLRIKQIENNAGKTVVSEGLDANYLDIINYAVFALIKIEEAKS